jgi:hypothetical protein
VSEVDAELTAALREQAAQRPPGARRVGWKIGAGERESIRGDIAIGHLTSATVLEPGSTYRGGGADLHADAEVALELGEEQTIAGYGVALEIVDLGVGDTPAAVVAANVFHRAVAFGPLRPTLSEGLRAGLVVNGELRASGPAGGDFAGKVRGVARLLRAIDERLRSGDRIITGSVVQVAIESGDVVVAELGGLDRVGLSIA